MIALTAIFRAKPGQGDAMQKALDEMTAYVTLNEPGTFGFYVVRDGDDPLRFITYERFKDRAAMDAHNTSKYRDEWVARFGALFDGALKIHTGAETAAKHG
ncbi:MAG: antibiotic biosynthesis monooxygenase [Alphaproteobacteria bacterium]|nr:antibiotic biosynthesis monooxygenase [Alphaproteobacteria bacterium]